MPLRRHCEGTATTPHLATKLQALAELALRQFWLDHVNRCPDRRERRIKS
jgi:hypothetical protein